MSKDELYELGALVSHWVVAARYSQYCSSENVHDAQARILAIHTAIQPTFQKLKNDTQKLDRMLIKLACIPLDTLKAFRLIQADLHQLCTAMENLINLVEPFALPKANQKQHPTPENSDHKLQACRIFDEEMHTLHCFVVDLIQHALSV